MSLLRDLCASAQGMLDAFGGNTPDWLTEEAKALEDALKAITDAASGITERGAAQAIHGSDEIEVDDDALVSRADDGYWVSGWLWVPVDLEDAEEGA